MSTCVFARFDKLSNVRRAFFSHFITDEPFAIFTTAKKELISSSYFTGLFLVSWCAWVSGAVIGAFATNYLPVNLIQAMNIALYALFIAIVVPAAKSNNKLFSNCYLCCNLKYCFITGNGQLLGNFKYHYHLLINWCHLY